MCTRYMNDVCLYTSYMKAVYMYTTHKSLHDTFFIRHIISPFSPFTAIDLTDDVIFFFFGTFYKSFSKFVGGLISYSLPVYAMLIFVRITNLDLFSHRYTDLSLSFKETAHLKGIFASIFSGINTHV